MKLPSFQRGYNIKTLRTTEAHQETTWGQIKGLQALHILWSLSATSPSPGTIAIKLSTKSSWIGIHNFESMCSLCLVKQKRHSFCFTQNSISEIWFSTSAKRSSFWHQKEEFITCSKEGEHWGSFPKQCLPQQQAWGIFKLRVHAHSWRGLGSQQSTVFTWLKFSWGSEKTDIITLRFQVSGGWVLQADLYHWNRTGESSQQIHYFCYCYFFCLIAVVCFCILLSH